MLKERKTTNILLLIIVIPIMFYLLKVLSFIFIPLVFAMFIALLFLPIMRWLSKRNVPKLVSIIIVFLLIACGLTIGIELIKLSSKQILSSDTTFFAEAEVKLNQAAVYLENTFGLVIDRDKSLLSQFIKKENIGTTVGFLNKFLTGVLMTVFFVVLLLAESINMHDVLNKVVLKQKRTSLLTYGKIQKEINTFIKVKFLVSFLTGVGTGLACYFFDVSFPIFWGLLHLLLILCKW